VLAGFFLATGITKIASALQHKDNATLGWLLAGGVISCCWV